MRPLENRERERERKRKREEKGPFLIACKDGFGSTFKSNADRSAHQSKSLGMADEQTREKERRLQLS
jgi:hypothetical protein